MVVGSRRSLSGLALALAFGHAGCQSPPPACRPSTTPAPVAVPVAAAALEVLPASTPAPGPPRSGLCWARGSPAARPAKVETSYCNPLDPRVMAVVEARLRKDLVVTEKPSKLVVDYGCDAAGTPERDVFFESGSGHGGSLRIVRLHRESDRIVVRAIDSSHYHGKSIAIGTADLDARALDRILPAARVALIARPHMIRLIDPSGGLGLTGYSSSNDFHLRLSIVDDAGQLTDGQFTGYDGSGSQEQMVPVRIATEALAKLLDTISLTPVAATDADRAMLTARFLVTMDRDPYWWVEERYIALVAQLGTIDAVPALAAIATSTKRSDSGDRAREAAVDAIAAITTWNPRVGPRGAKRSLREAAIAIAKECGP